jgi:long-chain acyl-CoA synthetase
MISLVLPANLGKSLAAGSAPDALAMVDLSDPARPKHWSYAEFDALADAVAGGLRRAGIAPGQRVGLVCGNSARAVAVLLGSMRAGCVAVPVNPRAGAETLRFMLVDASMAIIFADAASLRLVPADRQFLCLDGPQFESFLRYGASEAFEAFEAFEPRPDDPALILYTSGSTGRPKGVLLSHSSQLLIAAGYATPFMADCLAAGPAIVAAPIFHMNATVNLTTTFLLRGALVLLARFEPVSFIAALATYRVSMLSGVPTMAALIAQERAALAHADLSGIKLVAIGSAPLSMTVLDQVHALFPGAGVINSYGTTETGAGYFGVHPQGLPRPPMSIGYPQPHAEMRLVGDSAPDEGVFEIRTPTRMSGYLKRPELAGKVQDGWINTGDIMRRDVEGWYYFVGRADDMFVCSGENVYPGAVERVIERHPDISEVCVLPLPDAVRGQIPVAFVVTRQGAGLTEQDVKQFVLDNAAPHLHPRRVWFIDQMPLGGTNKIDRKVLAARATEVCPPEAARA